jgi:hypothetical protein
LACLVGTLLGSIFPVSTFFHWLSGVSAGVEIFASIHLGIAHIVFIFFKIL